MAPLIDVVGERHRTWWPLSRWQEAVVFVPLIIAVQVANNIEDAWLRAAASGTHLTLLVVLLVSAFEGRSRARRASHGGEST